MATESKPFGDGIALAGERCAFVHEFAHCRKELGRVVRSELACSHISGLLTGDCRSEILAF